MYTVSVAYEGKCFLSHTPDSMYGVYIVYTVCRILKMVCCKYTVYMIQCTCMISVCCTYCIYSVWYIVTCNVCFKCTVYMAQV